MAYWEAERKEGGGGDRRDGNRDRIICLEDNIANIILGTEPNTPIAYDPGLEHHHLIMSMLGDPRGRLERERYHHH